VFNEHKTENRAYRKDEKDISQGASWRGWRKSLESFSLRCCVEAQGESMQSNVLKNQHGNHGNGWVRVLVCPCRIDPFITEELEGTVSSKSSAGVN
jgi:hypothetical protein